ncbi:MAG: alkaline phosphatase [Oscillospiraceae bacterium]|nr:alkaline phosphatase [Oscillospiraceae bacterium]
MKRAISLLLAFVLLMGLMAGCTSASAENTVETAEAAGAVVETTALVAESLSAESTEPAAEAETETGTTVPKYVFLFNGDGMSYPQIQATADYLGALDDEDYFQAEPSLDDNEGATLDGPSYLNFMNFEAVGSAVTYDSNSFCPDSASTATSISTGNKTYSGTINMDETGTVSYTTIAEKLRDMGYDIGIVTSVNLNHATPAAFYAHQASRSSYYEIGLELIASDFEYFAGGGLLKPTGSDGEQDSLYDLAAEAGYTVVMTQEEAEAITSDDEKVIIIDENLADSDAMAYELDRTDDMWSLADMVKKGIEVLDEENGFFMMCEGGKIDWACHANDAASTINDTIAFAEAVQVAIDFAAEHPDETLIIVTGDHETGGLTIGFAGTDYDTYITLLESQTISFAKYDSDYVSAYKENQTSFEDVLADIETLFGLKTEGDEDDKLVLTDYELSQLETAYEKSINGTAASEYEQEEYVLYGTYEPLTVTITHIINNKSGISFTSYSHTGLPVAVFADGVGADLFDGYYDNTEIYYKLAGLLGIE